MVSFADESPSQWFSYSAMTIPDFQTLMLPVLKLTPRWIVGCRIEETLYIKHVDEEFFE